MVWVVEEVEVAMVVVDLTKQEDRQSRREGKCQYFHW